MTTSIPAITKAPEHTIAAEDATAEAVALDWLMAKDIENAAKDAEGIRKTAGKILNALIGKGGKVTVNKGGFRTYTLTVSERKGQPTTRALDILVEQGKVSREDADAALEASRGASSTVIGLKADKT